MEYAETPWEWPQAEGVLELDEASRGCARWPGFYSMELLIFIQIFFHDGKEI